MKNQKRNLTAICVLLLLFGILITPNTRQYKDVSFSSKKNREFDMISNNNRGSIWIQTTDGDFNEGIVDNTRIKGSGTDGFIELDGYNGGELISTFGNGGRVQNNPGAFIDLIESAAIDQNHIYLVGYDSLSSPDRQWHIEKRDINTGALVHAFDGDGIVQVNPSSVSDRAYSITIDSNYLYIVGEDYFLGNSQWRIEKRDKNTGEEVTAFGIGGVITNNPGPSYDKPLSITQDNSHIYIAGYEDVSGNNDNQWRIEKRSKIDGALISEFDGESNGNGIVTSNPVVGDNTNDYAQSIAVDDKYLYAFGVDTSFGNYQWRIEKRDKTTGLLISNFDGDGIIIRVPSGETDWPNSLTIDKNYIYIVGSDSDLNNEQWRIEKINITTGALVNEFDQDGVIQINPSIGYDEAYSVAIDEKFLYVTGWDNSQGNDQIRVEKRNITSGALVNSFNDDGIVTSNPSVGADQAYTILDDTHFLYVTGHDSVPGNPQMLVEKRAKHDLHNSSGHYISKVYDVGFDNIKYQKISWNSVTPSSTNIKFQMRSASNKNDLSSEEFLGPNGDSNTFYISSNETIWDGHNGNIWIQYKIYLNTTDPTATPRINDICIYFNVLPDVPILLTPQNNTWINTSTPNFTWSYYDEDSLGGQKGFHVQISKSNDFSTIDFDKIEEDSNNGFTQLYELIPDGSWYWRVRTKDHDGDWGEFSDYWILCIDTTPVAKPNDLVCSPNDWTNDNFFEINLSLPSETDFSPITSGCYYHIGSSPPISLDDGSWVDVIPFTIINAPEGVSNVYVWLEDQLGNSNFNNHSIVTMKLDTKSPLCSMIIENDIEYVNTRTIGITITAQDIIGSGILEMIISENNEYINSVWLDHRNNSQFTLSEGDGNKTVYCKVKDGAGNEGITTSDSIILDTNAPSIMKSTPIDNAINVSLNSTISVIFSEEMNLTSVEKSILIIPNINLTIQWESNMVMLINSTDLKSNVTYTILIDSTAKDKADNHLDSGFTLHFTTTMKKNIGNTTIDNGTNKDDKLDDDIADDDTIGNDDSIEDDDDTSGDDDTTGDDDDPSNQKGPRDEKSNIYLIISVIACIFLILFVIISAIIILNRRRKRNQEADHIIEGDVNTSRPVNWEEEYNQEFESETSEIPSKERSDEYPVGYDIPIEENPFIDKSDAEKRDSFTYVTYESVSCQICFGNVKPGDTVYRCSCGKTFHTSCADRVGECPLCEKEIITQYPSVPKVEYESFQDDNSKEEEISEVHDDDDEYYGPQKYAGEILTSDSDETEIPQIVTTADVSTPQGCYHLYNMLLAKKGLDMRIGSLSSKSDINKARKQIILMFHPDKWIENKDRATFFMQKVNVAWEVLSTIPRE